MLTKNVEQGPRSGFSRSQLVCSLVLGLLFQLGTGSVSLLFLFVCCGLFMGLLPGQTAQAAFLLMWHACVPGVPFPPH